MFVMSPEVVAITGAAGKVPEEVTTYGCRRGGSSSSTRVVPGPGTGTGRSVTAASLRMPEG